MKTIALAILSVMLFACQTEADSSTPNCNRDLGEGWGQGYGAEVESQTNLDSDRCAEIGTVWCCAL